jgi:anaerobic magnesium-protoporphyrin IX monomethyl ester cyclase
MTDISLNSLRVESGKAQLGARELVVALLAPSNSTATTGVGVDQLRSAAADSGIEASLVDVRIDGAEQTMEQAIFFLAGELPHEPDLFILIDEAADGYVPASLCERIEYHFPMAPIAVLMVQDAELVGVFDTYPTADYAFRGGALTTLIGAIADGPNGNSVASGGDIVVNQRQRENSNKLSELAMPYKITSIEGEDYKDIWLETPVAPKALAVDDTVESVFARERNIGRVLLVIPSQFNVYGADITPAYPWIGVLSIAAMLEKAGNHVEVIDMDADHLNLEAVLAHMESEKFDILGLTATTPTYPNAKQIAGEAKLRNPDIVTMFGGIHATTDWAECVRDPEFDFIAVGEAEVTVVELVDAILSGTNEYSGVKGIVYLDGESKMVANGARMLEPSLDNYPYPAHHLIGRLEKYAPPDTDAFPVASIMVSRGCPGQCTYCETKNIFGRKTRFRSPENVIGEIRDLVNNYGVKEIHFLDDVITANKKFVREFCKLLIAEPYRVNLLIPNGLRADMVNREILTLLKDAGLKSVGFGIETGNERVQKLIKKGITNDRVRESVKLSKELGLHTWGFFILGLPGDTEEAIRETIDFAIELDVKFAKFLILKPFPGSEVYYQLDERGLIDSRDFGSYGVYMPPVHHLEELTPERILSLQRMAFRRFYYRPSKILEHLMDIRSMTKFGAFCRGVMFIAAQTLKKRVVGIGFNTGG